VEELPVKQLVEIPVENNVNLPSNMVNMAIEETDPPLDFQLGAEKLVLGEEKLVDHILAVIILVILHVNQLVGKRVPDTLVQVVKLVKVIPVKVDLCVLVRKYYSNV
jgi:hypothetical protein